MLRLAAGVEEFQLRQRWISLRTQSDAISIAQCQQLHGTPLPAQSVGGALILELPLAMAALQQRVALADGGVLDHDLGIGIAPEPVHLAQQLNLPARLTADVEA